jgi:hypothetical protein
MVGALSLRKHSNKLSGPTNIEKILHQPREYQFLKFTYAVTGLQQKNMNLLILAPKLFDRGQHYKPFTHNMSQDLLINEIHTSGDFNIFVT